MNTYERIFGAGPRGLVISLALLALAWQLEATVNLPSIIVNHYARWVVFVFTLVSSIFVVVWSAKSLPPAARGKKLVTTGAYRYLRHPLYAAFLSCFNFGLAVLLNNWIYVIWVVLLHVVWHWNIGSEEKLMRREFPTEYVEYCKVTGRFIPRISSFQHEKVPQKARVSQSDVPALYDKLAWIYDVWGHLTESRARIRALELAAIQPGEHVLEVAVGTGLAFVHVVMRNPNGRNVGIDISQGMLSKAERRLRRAGLSNYELFLGSASSIEEDTNSFDILLCNYMFDLLDESEWLRVLTEFHRVIKPNGRLILVNMTFGEKLGSNTYERLYRVSPSLMGGCRGVQLSDVLQRNGFSVLLREYFQQLLFPSEVILACSS